jgi:hypothetical protein
MTSTVANREVHKNIYLQNTLFQNQASYYLKHAES